MFRQNDWYLYLEYYPEMMHQAEQCRLGWLAHTLCKERRAKKESSGQLITQPEMSCVNCCVQTAG